MDVQLGIDANSDVNKDFSHKDQDQDKYKDFTVKDKDWDQD